MKKGKNNKKQSVIFNDYKKYLKQNYPMLILLLITFLVVIGLDFFKVATSSTIASFKLSDYEVNQISDITIKAPTTLESTIDNTVRVEKDEIVIKKGFPISEEAYAKLQRMSESPAYIDYRAFANSVIFHLLMIVLFFFFLSAASKKIEFKELVIECFFYAFVYLIVILGYKTPLFADPYSICVLIPAGFCAFVISILFGQISAVFFSIMVSLSVLNACSFHFVPFLFTFASSFAATRIVRDIERRVDMVYASLIQALLNLAFILIFQLIFNTLLNNSFLCLGGVALNGFLSGILCLGMLTPFELILNTASPFRLMDLSDLNNPTMKKMLVTASGTYNHSMMVASLAESACNEIGANALLARVGAYYHDIGKLDNPEYFVENQTGIENIHNAINPSLSVSIIRSHVKRGVEKAYAMRLPKQIIDIISEHHGNQVIAFFYNEAKLVDENASPEDYSYTGNPPSTIESAVVMLADTVEAACRTIEKPSVPRLDKFIWTLINKKIESKQLEYCGLTFADLTQIHDAFVQILAGYYHSRIEYPDQKTSSENELDSKKTESSTNASKDNEEKSENSVVKEKTEISVVKEKKSSIENKEKKSSTEIKERKTSKKKNKTIEKKDKTNGK